jgi:hypothetical protein
MAPIDLHIYPRQYNHNSCSTQVQATRIRFLVRSRATVHHSPSLRPRLGNPTTSIPIKQSTATYPCDSSTKCKCNVKRTCSRLEQTRTPKTKRAARLQIAPCRTRNSHTWKTATWTSPPASSGRRISPTSSTPCKRDTRTDHHERRSRLVQSRRSTHRKITGVQGAALGGRMAQRPLLATFVIVGMIHGGRRYPAQVPRQIQLD